MSQRPTFRGFSSPKYTQVPDEFFDELMPDLTGSELKVLLYIIRRTFGFKKDTDTISLKQMVDGITTKDGRQLDRGTGLAKQSATTAVAGLVTKQIIIATRNKSPEKGDEPTTYQLRFATDEGVQKLDTPRVQNLDSPPVSKNSTPPCQEIGLPRVQKLDPQETVVQETDEQETDRSNDSIDPLVFMPKEAIERVAWVASDIALEFADRATAKATATRAANLYARSGLDLDAFLDLMQMARLRTKRYTGSIKAERGTDGRKPKMQYFFAVLENLVNNPEISQSAD